MKRTLHILVFSLIAIMAVAATKPIDQAKALYAEGKYAEAVTALEKILKASPRDMTANYFLGMSYMGLGEIEKAKAPLEKAEDRGSTSAAKALATIAMDQYRMDDAAEHIDTWESLLKKGKKKVVIPEELSEMRAKVITARNMLQRVEKIAIIDSIVVDKADFFKHYRLSAEAGKLLDGNILPRQYASATPSVVYQPENAREVFWAMPDSGATTLFYSQILDDGSFEAPQPLGGDLNQGGDADYFFLAPDGLTFYYASNGENSLGGYDIFLSRRDADGSILQPQNIGMPYNSPFDDYMLVIDEAAGLGWWATDRNQIPDKLTIYVFIPNETRQNYNPDDEAIGDYAFITSIRATQGDGVDRIRLLNNGALNSTSGAASTEDEFLLPLGNGVVYTSMAQFRSSKAKQTMQQLLDRQADFHIMQAKLDALRARYGSGDTSVGQEILSLEKRVLAAQAIIKRMRNDAIAAETQGRP